MSTALVSVGDSPHPATPGFTREQKDLIKRSLFEGSTDDEFALFIATAQRLRLDPFARQIFAVKRGGKMTIQVSIDGFRLVADRTGCYSPGRPTEYEIDGAMMLVSATAYVKKRVAGEWHEVAEAAYLNEYTSSSNALWKSMPRVMLAKCAEARALRRAFPAELSGVYGEDEMEQAGAADPIEPEIEVDELDWRLRISAAPTNDDLRALQPEWKALPDGKAKRDIGDLIAKRRLEFSRAYAEQLTGGAK